jgi:polyhydroxybutyrate depolymerase
MTRTTLRKGPANLAKLKLVAVLVLGVASVPPAALPTVAAATDALDGPAPSAGCGVSQQNAVTEEQRFVGVNGTERWYLVTVPGAHDGSRPLPLVISFHGLLEGAQIHTRMTEFSALAERDGFVVAFPQGQFDPVRWDASAGTTFNGDPNDDLTFVDNLIDTLGDDLCLDRRRVYAAGLSWGAFMTSLVTCARSQRFAAVAPVAGQRLLDPCPQDRAVPIITFHGTDDAIVLFNGGFGPVPGVSSLSGPAPAPLAADLNGPGIPANVAGMAARNGCEPTPADTQLTAEIIHRVYDCPAGADVEFYIVVGGGHAWPGSAFSRAIEAAVGYTTFDISASEEAWAFFQRFRLPCPDDAVCDMPAVDDPAPTSTTAAKAASTGVRPSFAG